MGRPVCETSQSGQASRQEKRPRLEQTTQEKRLKSKLPGYGRKSLRKSACGKGTTDGRNGGPHAVKEPAAGKAAHHL